MLQKSAIVVRPAYLRSAVKRLMLLLNLNTLTFVLMCNILHVVNTKLYNF